MRPEVYTTRVGRLLFVHTSACVILAYAFLTRGDKGRDAATGDDIAEAYLVDGTPIDLDPILITK